MIFANLLILVGLLMKDDSVREASTGVDPDSKVKGEGAISGIFGSQVS